MSPIKLAIAMPVEGHPESARVHYSVQRALVQLANVVRLDDPGMPIIAGATDIVRCRNRMALQFLEQTDCTHLLWWDEDVLPDDLQIINRMLETGFDVVGAPYRRKKAVEEYPFRLPAGARSPLTTVETANDCARVDHLAFGFMLTSRRALERMISYYRDDRWYVDVVGDEGKETVSIFGLQYTETSTGPDGRPFRVLLSEDYSFCQSWNAIGGQVWMYVGKGSPVAHLGECAFRGTSRGLGGDW